MSAVKRFTWESLPPASLRLSGLYSLPVSDPCRIQLPIFSPRTSCHLHLGTLEAFQMGCEKRVIGPTVCREAARIIWIYIFPCLFGVFKVKRDSWEPSRCKCQSSLTDRSLSYEWKHEGIFLLLPSSCFQIVTTGLKAIAITVDAAIPRKFDCSQTLQFFTLAESENLPQRFPKAY